MCFGELHDFSRLRRDLQRALKVLGAMTCNLKLEGATQFRLMTVHAKETHSGGATSFRDWYRRNLTRCRFVNNLPTAESNT